MALAKWVDGAVLSRELGRHGDTVRELRYVEAGGPVASVWLVQPDPSRCSAGPKAQLIPAEGHALADWFVARVHVIDAVAWRERGRPRVACLLANITGLRVCCPAGVLRVAGAVTDELTPDPAEGLALGLRAPDAHLSAGLEDDALWSEPATPHVEALILLGLEPLLAPDEDLIVLQPDRSP